MHDGRIKDVYTWHVAYADGSTLNEFDRPEGRGFAEVGDKQVQAVEIRPIEVDTDLSHFLEGMAPHSMPIPDGARPVFFRRRSLAIHIESGTAHLQKTIHCIGWKREDKALYLFILQDGSTVLTADLQAV